MKSVKKLYRFLIYVLALFIKLIVQFIPRPVALSLGRVGGVLCFKLLKKERKKALKNLDTAFGNTKDINRIAQEAFKNLGMTLMEWLRLPRMNKERIDKIIDIDGIEKISKVLVKGKGAIVLTSHLGNWEYLAAFFALNGFEGGVIARKIYYPLYNKLLTDIRKSQGVETLLRDGSVRDMLKVLRQNKLLGILPDQDTNKVEGIFVDFFGRPAYTPTGPVALALASGAGIIPAFIIRKGSRYQIFVEDPLELVDADSKDETIRINTENWSKIVERYIREYPEQWVWVHDRWRTKKPKDLVSN